MFESQVILCLLEICRPSMCNMLQELSPDWRTIVLQLSGIMAALQTVPFCGTAILVQVLQGFFKATFVSDEKFVVYIKLQMSPVPAWGLVKDYFNR